jgi:putative membrane protein
MAELLGVLLAAFLLLIGAAIVIYIVSRLNLGMTVDSFGSAIIAALVIAVVAAIINFVLNLLGLAPEQATFLNAIIALIIAAVVLMISGNFVSGMQVNGFGGAIIAAIGIGVVRWLISFVLNLFI